MQRRTLNALSNRYVGPFDSGGTTRPGRIQKNAIVGMMMNEDEQGKEDIIFYNLDKVVPVLE